MKTILTAGQMKALDHKAVNDFGIPECILMERAGLAVYESIKEENYPSDRILVLCSSGNNGGDGFCIARLFAEEGKEVSVFFTGSPSKMSEAARLNHDICKAFGVPVTKELKTDGKELIIDALYGIGLNRQADDETAGIFEAVNEYRSRNGSVRVVSVDIASGVYADSGRIAGCAVRADMTVTFSHIKPGHVLYPGKSYTGLLKCKNIGIPDKGLSQEEKYIEAVTADDLPLIKRRDDSNKGTYGKALIIAGSKAVSGCAVLAALSCFKTGAGMVRVLTHSSNRDLIINALPEAMVTVYDNTPPSPETMKDLYSWATVTGIGPGTGRDDTAEFLVRSALYDNELPLVADADAIELLRDEIRKGPKLKKDLVITPHVGEMSRFTGLSVDEIKKDPMGVCREYAERYGITVCLKDAVTVTGDSLGRLRLNMSGNNGMSVAGMGDVLFGIITSLMAQGAEAFDAASFGAYIHGACGDRCISEGASKSSLMPTELIDKIRYYAE
ncbi:MAG: NAD(P)H-hydrate dehydratase [Lachnospiraceae bacterium]|nr:NAD(P)H-hydrate dehydratase [Lachnospiraceae bacterium]